jgi:hypothetical protein
MQDPVTITLPPKSAERLEEHRKKTGAASIEEVIQNALQTHITIANQLAQGSVFTIHYANGGSADMDWAMTVERETRSRPKLRVIVSNED